MSILKLGKQNEVVGNEASCFLCLSAAACPRKSSKWCSHRMTETKIASQNNCSTEKALHNSLSSTKQHSSTLFSLSILLSLIVPFITTCLLSNSLVEKSNLHTSIETECYKTCSIRVVESIPDNITFRNATLPPSTFYAWNRLIEFAEKDLYIAAYKSSLQGKHVLGHRSDLSVQGDFVYDSLLHVGTTGRLNIKMVENYPPKDKGDNADGIILQNKGAVHRRSLNIEKILGRGKMHSKFVISDNKHFYLGSANLDWRSLNQKMELGVLVENCKCLGEDLRNIFDVYWDIPQQSYPRILEKTAYYNMKKPLQIDIEGERSAIYLATSPKELSNRDRTWDLDAIVTEIDNAKESIDIHVMDYFPLFIYKMPKVHFPTIDDALRRAVLRGVHVRILAAALHYPEIGVRFLRSLASLNNLDENTTIEVRIFKVPSTDVDNIVVSRERRTHNKFMVSETAVIIGTSNWSGDYFVGGTTGAAVVIKQDGEKRALVREMQAIFERDWSSDYAHPLEDYFLGCIERGVQADFCEGEKDPSLLASPLTD
ncbi:phospholipase D domain protein [Necator americanus]|uniref:Phospholipase D domain protein n=1 Tax=Necator americanus TaxID=51031 RepID=W2SM25_NECAM|nr:phospholipase D domain protein [Necator americanus]ETN70593.1 phospholipase D domain protein [Necator americanus]